MRTDGMTPAEKIEAWSVPEPNTGCWLWLGSVFSGTGYAQLWTKSLHRSESAHRVSYEAFVGPIPRGLHIDHLCRVKSCVNPAHLEPVTQRENSRRGLVNQYKQATHCKWGHPLTPENTSKTLRPVRKCKTCHREGEARRRAIL